MGVSDLVDYLVYELSSDIALKINSNALNTAAEFGHFMICKTLVDQGADLTEVRTIPFNSLGLFWKLWKTKTLGKNQLSFLADFCNCLS